MHRKYRLSEVIGTTTNASSTEVSFELQEYTSDDEGYGFPTARNENDKWQKLSLRMHPLDNTIIVNKGAARRGRRSNFRNNVFGPRALIKILGTSCIKGRTGNGLRKEAGLGTWRKFRGFNRGAEGLEVKLFKAEVDPGISKSEGCTCTVVEGPISIEGKTRPVASHRVAHPPHSTDGMIQKQKASTVQFSINNASIASQKWGVKPCNEQQVVDSSTTPYLASLPINSDSARFATHSDNPNQPNPLLTRGPR
ncbi:hypothetical protein CPB84DRAFT_1755510 [Gymnopilus junonius]|uniref:Uncharacterized protein n=1 Tax=Gymnopilus junonius TaxID=109634 RepID=A0A9P5N6M1_GYMJU|nr:hypothetical protein CPB84DRAFT_1755510 [Gymnopilus junonius]